MLPSDALLQNEARYMREDRQPLVPVSGQRPSDIMLQREQSQRESQLRAVVERALKDDPELAAERQRLSQTSGLPVSVVERNLDEIRRKEAARALDIQRMMRDSPILARQLLDPSFTTVAQDDIGVLGQIERFASDLGGAAKAGVFRASRGAAGTFQAAAELVAPVLDPLESVTAIGGNPLRRLAEGFAMAGASAGRTADAARPKSDGIVGSGFFSGIESLTQNLLALPMAFLPGGQGAALTMMTAGAGGGAYQDAREKGLPMSQALPFATSQAAIEYATEKLPLGALLKDVKAGAGFLQILGRQIALEVPGEQIATVLQDLNEWAILNPDKPFSTYLEERPSAAAQTLIATIVGTGGNVAVVKGLETALSRLSADGANMQRAGMASQALERAFELASQSALRERSPEQFRNLMGQMSGDAKLYVDGEVLNQLPPEALAVLPAAVRDKIAVAAATGDTVEINVADALTAAPGTPLAAALTQHARTSPDAPSAFEAQAAGAQAQVFLQQEAERVIQQAQDQAAARASQEAVKANIKAQLQATGRFRDAVNDGYATWASAFYTAYGSRMGMTAEQFFQRYPLRILGAAPGQQTGVLNAPRLGRLDSIEAFHYSKADRPTITTSAFGTGLEGSNRERYMTAADKRLRKRSYFYVDKGTGINPEAGVGGRAQRVNLDNVYDADADPLRLKTGRDPLGFESAVLDAGFSGYLTRMEGTQSGQVIMLGDQTFQAEVLGPMGRTQGRAVPAPAQRPATGRDVVADALRARKDLPGGELTRQRWGQILERLAPAEYEAMAAAGVFEGEGRFYKDGLIRDFESRTQAPTYEQAAVERLQMVAARGIRETAERAMISAEERTAIDASAKATGVSVAEIEAAVRKTKMAHPVAQGWEPLTYSRTVVEGAGDDRKVMHEYKTISYQFSADADGKSLEPGTANYTRRVNAVARGMVEEVRTVFKRAAQGDANARNILAQAGWYKAMRTRLRQEFGGMGDLFADLLGATSPNTPVRDNWFNAVDALRRASRGDFDQLILQWEAYFDQVDALETDLRSWFNERQAEGLSKKAVKDLPEYKTKLATLRAAREFPDALLPKKESGSKYGFNGRNVARAMVDLWRVVKNADPDITRGGTAPKALNFSGNLIGFRQRATIDVWAARMLQRLAGRRRIPSVAETGVSGEMREDATTTLQFGFGQDVFAKAARDIRNDPELNTDPVLAKTNDDDLQAVVWFVEKEVWTVNDWTSAAGEGGSFELEANLTGTSQQSRVKELRSIIDASPPTSDLVTAGQDTTEALKMIEDHERAHEAEIEELRKLESGEVKGTKKRMTELGRIVRPPVEATRLLGNVERAKARLEAFSARKVVAKAELAALEREVDRFVGGLSIQMSKDTQGVDFVPTDADMARLAEAIRLAVYAPDDGSTVLGAKALSTQGRYGGIERSLDLEVVAREGYDANGLWLEMLRQAQAARQDSTFLSRVLRVNEDVDYQRHRPGAEIYFRSAADAQNLEKVLADLAQEGVEFLTVIVDGRRLANTMAGEMPAAVGVRLQYVPEFEQRYGMDDFGGLDDVALADKIKAKASELRALAERVSASVEGVSFAGQFWYDTQVAFSAEYQEKIDALTTGTAEGGAGGIRGPQWTGQPVRAGLEGADRQVREIASGQPGGDVFGGDQRGAESSVLNQAPSRIGLSFKDVVKRTPELQAAAEKVKAGEMTAAEYAALVDQYKPVEAYADAPLPASTEDMQRALTSDKTERIGVPSATLEAGHPIGLRLDIPAYANHGVWVVSVHEQEAGYNAGKSIGYESVASATDVTFGVVEKAAMNIASGKPKATIAVMKGGWKPTTPEEAKAAADAALSDPAWVQVGMDPERHSYFYDRATMEPVVAADEVIQVGPLVLAKNPRYGDKQDFLFQAAQTPRGTFNPQTLELVLNPNADLSTFFHETGHFFLEVMADIASQPGAPAQITEDMNAFLKWAGVPDLATWNNYSLDQKRPYHERWAESIEQYVMEGKAPSVELAPVMRRFRAWLVNVYQSIKQFVASRPGAEQQPLNDDIRRVMDRMVATDEQIQQANEVAGLMPDEQADGEAAERLQKRSIADLKWAVKARDKVIAKLKREAKTIEKTIRAEVTTEIDQRPEVLAKAAIEKAEKEFEADPVSADMNIAAIADSFGYPSVEAMYRAIDAFGDRAEAIDGTTERRMLEEHGDLIDERAITEAANEAVHNEARARSLATELRTQQEMLNTRTDTGQTNARGARMTVNVLVEAAKQFGTNVISRTALKDLRATAWKHTAAERRAGKRWQEATMAGDTAAAVKAKQDQVLNNAAAKAALDAAAEAKKILEFFARVTKGNDEKTVEKGRDPDIVNAARSVLAMYGIETPASKGAAAYLEVLQRNDPDTYNAIAPMIAAATQNAQPLEALTFEELQGLEEAVRAMWFLAKRSRQMEVDGNLLDIDDAAQELFARMEVIGIPDRVPGEGMAVTEAEERGLFLKQGIAFLRRVEQWAEGMDGKYGGPFLRLVFQPIKDAADRYRKDRVDYRKKFQALVEQIPPIAADAVIEAPELGYTFGTPGSSAGTAMNEILHAIGHTGNDSNKRKLLLGRGWATELPDGTLDTTQWDAFINRLVAEGKLVQGHYDFVQGMWDLLEETKPLAQKAHRDAFGRYFSEVTANEFIDPFGVMRRGGYLPAQVDGRLVKDNALRKLAEEENNSMAFAFPQPAKGFTMARTEYNRPLMLDLRSLSQHLDKVLLFSHMTNPARDVRKLLTRKEVSQPLDRIQPAALESMLQPWLQRSAQQIVETPIVGSGKWGRIPGIVRARAGMALMFGNVSNAVQQITGLTTAAVRVKPSFLMRSLAQYVSNPRQFSQAVWGASPYMDDRAKNEVAVLNEQMQAILINPSTYTRVQDWSSRHAYFLQTALDNVLSPIVWAGAYNQALADGMSDKDAVRFADSTVRQTQGSTLPEDVSRFETGPAYARVFTQFVGYFNMMANTNGTALKQLVGEVGLKRGAGKALYIVMMGMMASIWIAEAIALAFRGGPEDEDDDGWLDDWLAEVFGMGTVKGLLAQIPIAGQFAVAGINRLNDNPLDDRVSLSPAVSLLESAAGAPQSVYNAIVEEGSAQKAIRDVATLVSVATGIPLYGAARPIGYAAGVMQGRIEPEGLVDAARGLITGTASPESRVP